MSGHHLTRACDMCGSPDGVLVQVWSNHEEYQCRTCARRHALYTAAYDQLEVLMREAVRSWLPIWGDLPGVIDLGEQLNQIGHKLQGEWKAGEFDAEGVQPAQLLSNAAD